MGIIYSISFLFVLLVVARMHFKSAIRPYMTKRVLAVYGLIAILPVINTVSTVLTLGKACIKYEEYKAKGKEWMQQYTIDKLKELDSAILRLMNVNKDDN